MNKSEAHHSLFIFEQKSSTLSGSDHSPAFFVVTLLDALFPHGNFQFMFSSKLVLSILWLLSLFVLLEINRTYRLVCAREMLCSWAVSQCV